MPPRDCARALTESLETQHFATNRADELFPRPDRKSTRLNSSHSQISYAVFCLKKTSGRDPLLWPFSRDSIWNLPIGASAVYVAANLQQATQRGMTTDPDVIILTPNATMPPGYYNSDGWSGGSRCATPGNVLYNAPIPGNFVVQGAGPNNPDGTTPNYATAILMPDGHTLTQGQPFARCTADGSATMWWSVSNDLYGTGVEGGHGGSKLSSIGGTIRLGELVPGGVIRHVMKVNLYGL